MGVFVSVCGVCCVCICMYVWGVCGVGVRLCGVRVCVVCLCVECEVGLWACL